MAFYDNPLTGGTADPAIKEAKRQRKELQRIIANGAANNYNNSPEYYDQIKALGMQAGIPVPPPKGDLGRAIMGMATSFLTGGLVSSPAMTGTDRTLQGIGSAASWFLPFGPAAKVGGMAIRGVTGALRGAKAAGFMKHPMISAITPLGKTKPLGVELLTKAGKSKAVSTLARDPNVLKGVAEISKKNLKADDIVGIREAIREVFGAKAAYNDHLYKAVVSKLAI